MNIAYRIREASQKFPHKKSVIQGNDFYTFQEFEERSNQIAHRLQKLGITKGTRTLLFVKPCLDFSVVTFALFKVGAVPVLIDPGMGMKNLLSSIRQVRPEAMVGIGKVHWLRRLLRKNFQSVKIKISLEPVGGRTHYLYEDLSSEKKEFSPVNVDESDHSAILFTSGGTGIPKGVLYTHGILNAQTDALRDMFGLDETQIDLPGFPLFALFTLAMGMTSAIPDMDPTCPAQCDPKKLVNNILTHQATFLAGSPAIWERVGRYCVDHHIQLGCVRQVVMFGAPVRLEIHQMFQKILPFGDTYTPYGATECLPVSLISGSEILKSKSSLMREGNGTCIGRAVPRTEITILKTSDMPELSLHEVPRGEIGEIAVAGKQVTSGYFEMDDETKKAKILVGDKLWHRMGDLGHIDEEGHLWFLGRKAHRVESSEGTTHYPIRVEAIFNRHPQVKRTALLKLVRGQVITPGLAIERKDGKTIWDEEFLREIGELGQSSPHTRMIKEFFLHPGFPVDVRHNIKIDRNKLSEWANVKKVGASSP